MAILLHPSAVWPTQHFKQVLKTEIEALGVDALLLAKATQHGGFIDEEDVQIGILEIVENEHHLNIMLSIFFSEMVINCGCGDEPYAVNNHAQRLLRLDKHDGCFQITTLDD